MREVARHLGNDVWISALAVEHRFDVVSHDTEFDRVAGVRWRRW